MNFKLKIKYVPVIALVGILLFVNVMLLTGQTNNVSNQQSHFNIKGVVKVQVQNPDGSISSQTENDTINTNTYDYIICVLFNSPEGCVAALGYGMMVTAVTTVTTTATLPLAFSYPVDPFVMTGIGVSSGIVTSSGCAGLLTTNGFAAANSAESHTVNTNQVTLTESWTNTGSSQAVQSVCLFPFAIKFLTGAAASSVLTSSLAFAWETFSSQTVANGQSISVTWTFSF